MQPLPTETSAVRRPRLGDALPSLPVVAQARLPSPLGELTAWASEAGLMGLWFDADRHRPAPSDAPAQAGQRHIEQAARWLDRYWAGAKDEPEVALDLRGTPFQRVVWQSLLGIGHGRTLSYGEIARQTGYPAAVRAVGAAIGRNPVSILVPCHRVIGRDGSLTGYAGGLPRKLALLQLEGSVLV